MDTLAFNRQVTRTWQASITREVCIGEMDDGCVYEWVTDTTRDITRTWDLGWDALGGKRGLNSSGGPDPGRSIGFFESELRTEVEEWPVPNNTPRCEDCDSVVLTKEVDTGSYPVTGEQVSELLPIFWDMWELYGVHTPETEQHRQGAGAVLVQLKKENGLDWIHQDYTYNLDYYTCFTAENGKPLKTWEVAVPWPRWPPRTRTLRFTAAVGDRLEPPQPQTFLGWTNLHKQTIDPTEAPPVHVPIPLYDVGSGVTGGTTDSPDGNWWASVGSIPPVRNADAGRWENVNCLQMGKVPVCLAEAFRPWRAVWYIEPPPENVRDENKVGAPRDVQVCSYSDGTIGWDRDLPRERRNTQAANEYQVVVEDPMLVPLMDSERRAKVMLHTLSTDAGRDDWITRWLYGPDRSRNAGQDQQNPDRWCYYTWYQAQHDPNGFQGILAVEWLATAYLGVPKNSDYYCLDGPHRGNLQEPGRSSHYYRSDHFNCAILRGKSIRDSKEWFDLSVDLWNDPDGRTSHLNLQWLGTTVDPKRTCYVGTRRIQGMSEEFDWYLQDVAIIQESEREIGRAGNPEPAHTLGGGRTPADSSMQLGSAWTVDPRRPGRPVDPRRPGRPVATPQTNNPTEADPNNMTQHPANAGHRTFLSHVRPLQYPPDLEVDIKDHPDCDLPIKHIPLPDPSWYQLFGQGNADTGDLWAWWGQQVSEVRAQISPVPAG